MYIYSTLSADVNYTIGDRKFAVAGKANVANRNIITPRGMVTKATAEEVAELKKNRIFALHLKNGFLTIEDRQHDVEKVASSMEARDKSAPDTENDLMLDAEVESVEGTTVKRKKKK